LNAIEITYALFQNVSKYLSNLQIFNLQMLHLKLSVHAKTRILKGLSYILSLNLVCTYILYGLLL